MCLCVHARRCLFVRPYLHCCDYARSLAEGRRAAAAAPVMRGGAAEARAVLWLACILHTTASEVVAGPKARPVAAAKAIVDSGLKARRYTPGVYVCVCVCVCVCVFVCVCVCWWTGQVDLAAMLNRCVHVCGCVSVCKSLYA
jgi:hypothetical protein